MNIRRSCVAGGLLVLSLVLAGGSAGCRSSGPAVSPDYFQQIGRLESLGRPAADAWRAIVDARARGEKQDPAYIIDVANANIAVQLALGSLSMDAGQRRPEPTEETRRSVQAAEAAVGRLVIRPAAGGAGR